MTPEEINAEAQRHFAEGHRLLSLLPTDFFPDQLTRRHSDAPRGEGIEAAEIEGVSCQDE